MALFQPSSYPPPSASPFGRLNLPHHTSSHHQHHDSSGSSHHPNNSPPVSEGWLPKLPVSQSRAYVSPDPSPREEDAFLPHWGHHHPNVNQHAQSHSQSQQPKLPVPVLAAYSTPPSMPKMQFPNRRGLLTSSDMPTGSGSVGDGGRHTGMGEGDIMPEMDPFYNSTTPPPEQLSKKKKKKAEGKQPTFLIKLYSLLSQPEYSHIIRWDEAGESVIIENPEELADKILPVVYRQSRFASFSRQLNIYGFNRKLSLRNVEKGICDPDASSWSHPFLRRDSTKEQILSFKRRVPPRPSQAQKRLMLMGLSVGINASHAPVSNGDDQVSPTSSEHSLDWQSPPDPYQHHILPDVDEESPFVFPTRHYFSLAGYGSVGYEGWKQSGAAAGSVQCVASQGEEGFSPTTIHYDYGTPPDRDGLNGFMASSQVRHGGSPKGLAIDNPHSSHPFNHLTQQQVKPSFPVPCQPLPLSLLGQKLPTDLIPQSAPANTGSFPIPIRVTQQHVRTRSVQGEPLSAMLFSPFDGELGEVPEPAGFSQNLNGTESHGHQPGTMDPPVIPAAPAYNPSDPSTWARRGFIDFNIAGVSDPLPFNPMPTYARLATSPHSLPTDMSPLHQQQTASPSELMGQSISSALSDDSPKMLPPGTYQSGFSLPVCQSPYLQKRISSLNPPARARSNPIPNLNSNAGFEKSPLMNNEHIVRPCPITQTEQVQL
ncbi:hypothetical protein L804_02322 [Cryptococcus deuterogattii 2001/935-1]|nr:hypothetical protein L804_02322 [Cryptococcus deuterogattii 2001/935-1]